MERNKGVTLDREEIARVSNVILDALQANDMGRGESMLALWNVLTALGGVKDLETYGFFESQINAWLKFMRERLEGNGLKK